MAVLLERVQRARLKPELRQRHVERRLFDSAPQILRIAWIGRRRRALRLLEHVPPFAQHLLGVVVAFLGLPVEGAAEKRRHVVAQVGVEQADIERDLVFDDRGIVAPSPQTGRRPVVISYSVIAAAKRSACRSQRGGRRSLRKGSRYGTVPAVIDSADVRAREKSNKTSWS